MPTYEYRCPKGHEFEVFHGMDEPPPEACEVCGSAPVARVFSPVPIVFKGSGFYATDYGRRKRKVEASSGEGDGGASKASDDSAKTTDKSDKSTKKAET